MINWDWKGRPHEQPRRLIVRYAVLTFTTAVIFATLTTFINPTTQIENVRALLTTLALAEASVLAIVFSVTVVALQLVVQRYSARLTTLFVKEPLFHTTFALFIGAIGFNLFTIYLLPAQSSRLTDAAVGIAFALATVSTFALYQFIQLMIQRSSPDELLVVLVERELAPTNYLPETLTEFNQLAVHPLRPLFMTVTRAIEEGDYQTVEQGIVGFQTVLTRTYTYLDTEYTGEDAADYAEAVSDEILTEYLPAILEQAYTHDRYDLVEKTVDSIETIALDGLAKGFSEIVEDTADGFGTGFEAAPLSWEGNRLRGPITESMVELSKATATKLDYGSFISVFGEINSQMKILLRRRPDSNVTLELVEKYFRQDSISIFELLLERYGPKLQDKEINWISPTNENGAWTLPDDAEPIRHFWRGYVDITQTVLRYRINKETYPFAPGAIFDGWRKAVKCAAESELDDLATLCCVSMIQLVYEVDQLGDGPVGLWSNNLAHLRLDYDSEIVDQAFVILQSGKQPVGANILIQTQSSISDDIDDGFFARFFNSEEEQQFEEWLVDFQKQVNEGTEDLQERN